MSEQSLEFNRMPEKSVHPGPQQSRQKSPCTLPSWDLCYIQCTDSIQREPFWTRTTQKKINHVPVIVWNPAYIEELEPDGEVDPVDPAPFISGNTPIITTPASEDEDVAEEVVEDKDEDHDDEDLSKTMQAMQDVFEELEELDREVTQELQGLNQEISNWVSSPCKGTDPPIITVPASEDENVTEDAPEDVEEDATQVL